MNLKANYQVSQESQPTSYLLRQLSQLLSQIQCQQNGKFKCQENHQAFQVCSSKKCFHQQGFICQQQNCISQKNHYKCKRVLITKIYKSIAQKVHLDNNAISNKKERIPKKVKNIFRTLYNFINESIQQLSKLRQSLEIQQAFYNYTFQQIKVINSTKSLLNFKENQTSMSGSLIYQILKQNKSKEDNSFPLIQQSQLKKQLNLKKQKFIISGICQDIKFQYEKKQQQLKNILFLDQYNQRAYTYMNLPSHFQQKKLKKFSFLPLKVNKKSRSFQIGNYQIINPYNFKQHMPQAFQKIQKYWGQVLSEQQLPKRGRYYFQINCQKIITNNFMIGIISEDCFKNISSYSQPGSILYFFNNGKVWEKGNSVRQIGKVSFSSTNGKIQVLIDRYLKEIHWCINKEYQGKTDILDSFFKDKKIYASIQTSSIGNRFSFQNVCKNSQVLSQIVIQKEKKITYDK